MLKRVLSSIADFIFTKLGSADGEQELRSKKFVFRFTRYGNQIDVHIERTVNPSSNGLVDTTGKSTQAKDKNGQK